MELGTLNSPQVLGLAVIIIGLVVLWRFAHKRRKPRVSIIGFDAAGNLAGARLLPIQADGACMWERPGGANTRLVLDAKLGYIHESGKRMVFLADVTPGTGKVFKLDKAPAGLADIEEINGDILQRHMDDREMENWLKRKEAGMWGFFAQAMPLFSFLAFIVGAALLIIVVANSGWF